jgi:hypothetical protein
MKRWWRRERKGVEFRECEVRERGSVCCCSWDARTRCVCVESGGVCVCACGGALRALVEKKKHRRRQTAIAAFGVRSSAVLLKVSRAPQLAPVALSLSHT